MIARAMIAHASSNLCLPSTKTTFFIVASVSDHLCFPSVCLTLHHTDPARLEAIRDQAVTMFTCFCRLPQANGAATP